MRIFLTGATGYIGSAVLERCFARIIKSPLSCGRRRRRIRSPLRGVTPVLGDLKTVKSYRAASDGFDSYIHIAADSSPRREEIDRKAIDTLMAAAAARANEAACSFVYTSGVWVLGSNAQPMDETAQANPGQLLGWRPAHEQLVLQAAAPNLRTSVIRPGIVYGGNRGIVSDVAEERAEWPDPCDREWRESLAAHLQSRPRRSLCSRRDASERRWDLSRERRSRRNREHHRRGNREPHDDAARRAPRSSGRGAQEDGRVCGRAGARSARTLAHVPARSAGRPRSTRSATTSRVCWKNSAARRNAPPESDFNRDAETQRTRKEITRISETLRSLRLCVGICQDLRSQRDRLFRCS